MKTIGVFKPTLGLLRLRKFIFLQAIAFVLATCSAALYGQGCPPSGPTVPPPPPALSASPGPSLGKIRVVGSNTDPCATTTFYFVLSNGASSYMGTASNGDQFDQVLGSLYSNWTYHFRAQSTNSLGSSALIETTAKTFDLPNPPIVVWSGPGQDKITYWTKYIGEPGYAVPVHLHMILPSGVDTNLANFYEEDIAPKTSSIGTAPGLYKFYSISDNINPLETRRSREVPLYLGDTTGQNLGKPSRCNSVGEPVNVIDGNMYLGQTDYVLPGYGPAIDITRSYNSFASTVGLFGNGWSTQYDESIIELGGSVLRLQMPDGQTAYFWQSDSGSTYISATWNIQATVTKNSDGSFQVTFKDGRVHKFRTDGRLMWLRDRNGNQTTLNYGSSGAVQGITDAGGRTLSFTLDANGNVSQIADALGTVATYAYQTGTNYLESVTYHDGSKYKFEYVDQNGRRLLATVKDALNHVLETHQYDNSWRAITSSKASGVESYSLDYTDPEKTVVTDGNGHVTKYHFVAGFGRNVVSQIEGFCSCGGGTQSTAFEYDLDRNLTKKTDALGRETTFAYDEQRNPLTITDSTGTRTFTYNAFGEVLTATDPMGGVTTNTYDSAGNLLTTTDALNHTSTMTYNSRGQLVTYTDANNHTTTLGYDSLGRLTSITDALTHITTFGYDARARVTSITNALSHATAIHYDDNNRVDKVTFPDASFVTATYDLAGRRTATTDELGHSVIYGYDDANRLTTVTDALSHARAFGYDSMSNLTSQTDAMGNVTNLEYDGFNRLKKIKYPLPSTGAVRSEESYTYDSVGNTKTHVDTAGRTTSYEYDNANRLIKTTDALANFTQFTYNARSQMTKVKDALNQEYLFTYDPLGRTLSETRADVTATFEYDAAGNRTKRVDYNGDETDYQYDPLDRLHEIDYVTDANTSVYEYDAVSRLTSATNEAGTVSFAYDSRNRQTSETDIFDHVIANTYDDAGRRTKLKLDGADYTTYAYDNVNRLTSLTDDASGTYTFAYDNADRLIGKTLPNGIATDMQYDGMSRLKRLTHTLGTAQLFDYQYTYNSADQIAAIADLASTKTYSYDNLDRLTGMTDGSVSESYGYDAVGNRTTSHLGTSYGYDTFNRILTSPAGTKDYSYDHDPNGNMQFKRLPPPRRATFTPGNTYEWNSENQLITVSVGMPGPTIYHTYRYDALGRRVTSDDDSYTYDGSDVIIDGRPAEGQVTAVPTNIYVLGTMEGETPPPTTSIVTKYQNAPGVDNKLSLTDAAGTGYFLQDHLGSTVGLADGYGTVTNTNTYDSFGNASNATFPTRYQYTGRELDTRTGVQYNRARWYDPNIGRFISEDPIGFAGGDSNLYAYVGGRSLLYNDPSGLQGEDLLGNPDLTRSAIQTVAAAGGIVAVAASSPAVVAGAGFVAGYGLGYYPGQALANWRGNPLVYGPWNPFGTPYPMLPPMPLPLRSPVTATGTSCQPKLPATPWFRDRTIPWPEPSPDRDGCAQEWVDAYEWCAQNIGKRGSPGLTGGYTDLRSCALGHVSQRCGGNRID